MCRFSSQVSSTAFAPVPDSLRLHANGGRDFFLGAQLEKVGDRATFGGAAHLGNFVNLLDVSASRFGEEHQVIVRRRGEEMLDEIAFFLLGRAFARGHADDAFAAAALRAKRAHRSALDETAMRDADDASLRWR